MNHSVAWHVAQPLWGPSLADGDAERTRFRAPAVLRFRGDDFMVQLGQALARPGAVADLALRAESWKQEEAGWTAAAAAAPIPKLYQPAHYRFYLVSASLVCQRPGLPDRRIEAARGESASFVVRRLFARPGATYDPRDPATYEEYGWHGTAQDGTWRPVPVRGELAPGEERLPLFPSTYDDAGQPRRVLAGLVPVARRDVYEAGAARAAPPAAAGAAAGDPFATEAAAEIAEHVVPALQALAGAGEPVPSATTPAAEAAQLAGEKLALAHALLDLVDFLKARCRPLWDALAARGAAPDAASRPLHERLARAATGTGVTYADVLLAVERGRGTLEDGDPDAAFVDALLGGARLDRRSLRTLVRTLAQGLGDLLAAAAVDPRRGALQDAVLGPLAALAAPGRSDEAAQDALLDVLLALADFLRAERPALWSAVSAASPGGLGAADRAVYDALAGAALGEGDWRALLADADLHRLEVQGRRYTPAIRVIALRPAAGQIATAAAAIGPPLRARLEAALAAPAAALAASAPAATGAAPAPSPGAPALAAPGDAVYVLRCAYERPRCKGFADAVVSAPTAPFRLASFFDADAPVRPTRILMPDVSLKALRRAPRGVQIALSRELRAQIERVRGVSLEDLGKGKLNDPQGFDVGLVCSLSIPIITIVALMLLIIIVSLLNFVFWWLPYFILCLPRIGRRA